MRTSAVSIGVGAILALGGCGDTGAESVPSVSSILLSGGASVTVGVFDETGDMGDSAQLTGAVRLSDGCLFVDAVTGTRYFPIFPRTSLEPASQSDGVLDYQGISYAEGQTIVLAGGAGAAELAGASGCTAETWFVHP